MKNESNLSKKISEYEDEFKNDYEELTLNKFGSFVAMLNGDLSLNSVDCLCEIAKSAELTEVLMEMLDIDNRMLLCEKLFYYYPKAITSKLIKKNFVEYMRKQLNEKSIENKK